MGTESGAGYAENLSTSNGTAVDSDGSDTWEDFFGTSTDLVPQLLGMFDELVRRGSTCNNHVGLPSCSIPAALQKRLSLVSKSRRSSLLNPLYAPESLPPTLQCREERKSDKIGAEMESKGIISSVVDTAAKNNVKINVVDNHDVIDRKDLNIDGRESDRKIGGNQIECQALDCGRKSLYNQGTPNGLSPLRYNRRCRNGGRPLSGSSIASSTSSSGCSNQGIASAVNPYLASVESLADNCASSQGSGDSGVVTVSDSICRGGTGITGSNQRSDSVEREPSTYQSRPRYCDPHLNPVERVLLEIVDTEAVYVEHLRQVIQGYLIFWRDDPTSLMDEPQLCDLFSNIEDIYEFNSEFLKEIEECELDPVCVANTFIKHNSGFKVYTEYCTNYPRTVAVLTDLMGHERTASAFRERQAALGHALPLGSFLLKPVQRILKYHLLLQNLSKECDAEVGENEISFGTINAIEGALAAMTGIARHINVMKRKHEHAVRVQEIQSLLYGWPGPDLTTSGELVAEGRFRMRGAKAPRHAFLFDRMLLLTKKKEDGLLVYKAHIVCSNLMLIESIPGEALSFHVIPFDNPRLQYTLQARNLEQKREWTMQIKRVILENYNAVIPSHARQLVMQLGQTPPDDESAGDRTSAKKQHSAPPEYLEKRKQERERRKSETGLRQRLRKTGRKTDISPAAVEDLPSSVSKNQSTESIISNSRDRSLNRSAECRTSKVKDRFASWRRKSEPGFQSYVSLNQSDEEEKDSEACTEETVLNTEHYETVDDAEAPSIVQSLNNNSPSPPPSCPPSPLPAFTPTALSTKENNDKQEQVAQTMEEIVGHILMQNRDFQKLLEKQRTSSIINMRQQQRFHKRVSPDTSDDSETENDTTNNNNNNNSNNRGTRLRLARREQRLLRANNARNSTSPPPKEELQLRYDNLRADSDNKSSPVESMQAKNRTNRINEKRAIFEAFKRQGIVTESKIIQTALRIRETSTLENNEDDVDEKSRPSSENNHCEEEKKKFRGSHHSDANVEKPKSNDESQGFGNYDNLQKVWEGIGEQEEIDAEDSPTKPAVWLTKLCQDLPTATQKCGSLPRSFQINPHVDAQPQLTKSRFLQRDGKPMNERPLTIASDKPAEINLEDMERYASSCQPEGRIAKFPTSTSTSTFFYSLEEAFIDPYSELHSATSASTNVHPDHKIYRPNSSAGTIFKNVFSKAGTKFQGLRSTESIETLECGHETEKIRPFRSPGYNSNSNSRLKKKIKSKSSRESSDVDETFTGCVAGGTNTLPSRVPLTIPSAYYKQGSSGLGARIAQADYADPAVLFGESRRAECTSQSSELKKECSHVQENDIEKSLEERRESEIDSFYEKSFETIENYVDADIDEVFRDSAIFSDMDEVISSKSIPATSGSSTKVATIYKVAPPIPAKPKPETIPKLLAKREKEGEKVPPAVARKPDYLKVRSVFQDGLQNTIAQSVKRTTIQVQQSMMKLEKRVDFESEQESITNTNAIGKDDVSAGQSRAGWVRKMVDHLQGEENV
ncbi:uncharacterized protein LOC105683163 isoform X2 [Athalia rosae]|uniref:uncharacterized protein LOC105683163 isoform X2 n=1 Tax=Athalia rosae TaxID=37344 RepID=UPI002034506D|nr:uncharacterized protein LOC105683163 isoform X2 [Athalia rosae]